ncbi:amino acid permease [Actinospica robiniae]|uniref:amino acid permease n=1 Tax=Actinospica robiniae TaxID=304901 RepID=UPI003CCBCD0B
MIGSGWLLGALYAANAAGPASLITWVVGGLALLVIALVMVELGGSRPMSGGLVRWPFLSSGRLVATLVGWGIWIAYATTRRPRPRPCCSTRVRTSSTSMRTASSPRWALSSPSSSWC